jgi:RNA polymerase sigma-70 factor (ECF subfamily)
MERILSLEGSMVAAAGRDEAAAPTRADLAMERYADGDEESFPILFEELEPRLRRLALHQTRSPAAAEDAVQQTFLQIHLARGRFIRGAAVLPWACAIIRRLLQDARRHQGYEARFAARAEGEPVLDPALEEVLDERQREAALWSDLARLPEHLREAFLLVKIEGLSVAEAAQVIGITPSNVKQRVFRAKAALVAAEQTRRRQP